MEKRKVSPSPRKKEDNALLPLIRAITDERGSYGYRRVTVLLNQQHALKKQPKVNHKRIYRIMKENGLLLPAYGKRSTKTHDGKIITLKK